MATGTRCAVLSVADLSKAWGAKVEVRRSQVEGKRYPLYLSTPFGPVPFNTPRAQDFLLNIAVFDGAQVPEFVEKSASNDPEMESGKTTENTGKNPEKPGFFGWIGDLSDG